MAKRGTNKSPQVGPACAHPHLARRGLLAEQLATAALRGTLGCVTRAIQPCVEFNLTGVLSAYTC